MPQPLTYPGVYVEEVASGVRTIAGVATSIGLFYGWAPKGPIDRAVRIFSFADFEREYGGIDIRSLLGYSVRHFFDNGGTDAYVIRIAKTELAEGDPATAVATPGTATVGDFEFTASSPGKWSENYRVRMSPNPADTAAFKIEVLGSLTQDVVVESFENLFLDSGHPRFAKALVDGRSRYLKLTTMGTAVPTAVDTDTFAGGTDGDVLDPALTPFGQAVLDSFEIGAIADKLDLFNIVCAPGLTDPTTVKSLQDKCAAKRAFLVVDCKSDASVDDFVTSGLAAYIGANPSYAALYFPWVRAPDPRQSGVIREFPPCGFIAGIMARTDARRGVWKAPAGTDAALSGALEFKVTLSDAQNGAVNPKAVNCLRSMPVYGNIVWGARTLEGDNDRGSEWKYVPVRRMALFLEESLFRGTQWVVFEPNDEPLWSQIRLNIGAFMNSLFRQGAFQGSTPREAYFVKCDSTTTTQDDINRGVVNIQVGFAPLKPAEFVVLHIQQMAGEIAT